MVDTRYFNFAVFKATMEVSDIDEITYGFILRSIFSHLKKTHGIDFDATYTTTIKSGSTTSSLTVPYTENLLPDQSAIIGVQQVDILTVVSDEVNDTTTFTISPTLISDPIVGNPVVVYTTIIPFDLQYAVFLHAKYLFESQENNTSVVQTAADATGNRVSVSPKLPYLVTLTYLEYSPNDIAVV